MNVLLDTNTFLWFSNDHKFLSPKAKALIKDPANIIWLSMASVWEMAIKVSLGKLEGMSLPLAYFVDAQVRKNNFILWRSISRILALSQHFPCITATPLTD